MILIPKPKFIRRIVPDSVSLPSKGPRRGYRSDIDGLRAVAVLAVVLYHAGLKVARGGYIGVDVFFVISGYLITQFVDQRISTGRFSILEFYERRVRRILPALFVLLLAATIVGVVVLLPGDLIDFAKTQIATLAFFPNVLFYLGSGYFDSGAKVKPLLHMWSLGVEEQFYIFFPPLMVLASRWKHLGRLRLVWLLAACSFVLSVWTVQHRGLVQAGFYLVPYRAWELLSGSLLALRALPIIGGVVRKVIAATGLIAIFVSIVAFSPITSFPGLSAALPVFGTAMVIYANESGPTLVGTLLSLRPFVFVGLISYSLYLWHWPVLVFAEQLRCRPLSPIEIAACVLIAFVGAILSWRFVEKPFRDKRVGVSMPALMYEAFVGATCLAGVALVCVSQHGFTHRFPPQALKYAASWNERDKRLDVCRDSKHIEKEPACHVGAAKGDIANFIVWGDSHAAALAPAFDVVANESLTSGWIATKPACLPLLDVQRVDTSGCSEFNRDVLTMIQRDNIPVVVLVARWAIATLGFTQRELDDGQPQALFYDSLSRTRSLPENAAVFDRGIRRLLSNPAMQGRKVVVLMDLPDTGVDTPRYLAHAVIWQGVQKDYKQVELSESPYALDMARVDDRLARIAQEFHVSIVNPKAELCSHKQCLIAREGRSLYRDSHHLTIFGALQLVDVLRPTVKSLVSPQPLHSQLYPPRD